MSRETIVRLLSVLARPIYGGAGCILCLHRVLPAERMSALPENRSIELRSDDLRAILQWVQKRGLEPISLNQIPERLTNGGRRFIAFTFDDGYRDNLTEALPIFREYHVPFTVNVTTGFVGRTDPVWWYSIERVLLEKQGVKFQYAGEAFDLTWQATTPSRDEMLQTIARKVRALGLAERNPFVTALCAAADIDSMRATRDLIMDWDEVRQLARDPMATIGAHGCGHYDLKRLSDERAKSELEESKCTIEKEIQGAVRHLAFPFGGPAAAGEREFQLARSCGFETALTTRCANLFRSHRHHLHALPRLGVSGNYPAVARLQKMESGLVPAVENRFKRVVTK